MNNISHSSSVRGLAGWLAISFVAGAFGAAASVQAGTFYAHLQLPRWAPPAGVFAPVWTLLYILMGVAAWMVWRARGWGGAKRGLSLYLTQLAANALWSWLFFAWHQGAWAFAEILLLWALILSTTIAFWRAKQTAGLLLLPYLLWVTFATALCFEAWQLNRNILG